MIRATVVRRRAGEQPAPPWCWSPRDVEFGPLIVMAYDLSAREREVTELLLRGLPMDAIAAVAVYR